MAHRDGVKQNKIRTLIPNDALPPGLIPLCSPGTTEELVYSLHQGAPGVWILSLPQARRLPQGVPLGSPLILVATNASPAPQNGMQFVPKSRLLLAARAALGAGQRAQEDVRAQDHLWMLETTASLTNKLNDEGMRTRPWEELLAEGLDGLCALTGARAGWALWLEGGRYRLKAASSPNLPLPKDYGTAASREALEAAVAGRPALYLEEACPPGLFPQETTSGCLVPVRLADDPKGRGVLLLADLALPRSPQVVLGAMDIAQGRIASAINNRKNLASTQGLVDSFIAAALVAVDSKDPGTRSHSERVALLTSELARAVDSTSRGAFAQVHFTPAQMEELRCAALLHDVGKIGVRDEILKKEKKLFPAELAGIRERFHALERRLTIESLEAYITRLIANNQVPKEEDLQALRRHIGDVSRTVEELWQAVLEANEPRIVAADSIYRLQALVSGEFPSWDPAQELLTSSDLARLSIGKGSLSDEERKEIEHHVSHSFRFLSAVKWTQELSHIPQIVLAHHERLNGSGYPRRLREGEIPLQAKIMAIADIYDALVAMDRPYKKAVPHERALHILDQEVRAGKLDKDLFDLFVEEEIGRLLDSRRYLAA